ncbi:MAG: hypothetical protein OQL19_22025 [Gammaproteobacteria bacterium]|nr:hypothetical protein [Gammaproteobacteria bacterium]
MKKINFFLIFNLSFFFCVSAYAQFWSFSTPIDITQGNVDKVFHHLESAGRRNIAVSSNTIAVVWEDNRSGNPAIYLALKNKDEDKFNIELKVSGQGEAYEPSIASMTGGRFVISWEEDTKIAVRIINASQLKATQLSTVLQLPAKEATQSGLTVHGNQIFVSLSERKERFNQIQLVQLEVDQQAHLKLIKDCRVDPEPVKNEQLYPTTVIIDDRIMVAWEDRRMGHTIIMGSLSQSGDFCQFAKPQRISQRPGNRKLPYGKGHGVSRVALAKLNHSEVLAAWADKRNFREGYDIYAAVYDKLGVWGVNRPVQDEFGGIARQWHTTVAGHPDGYHVVAWSDERESHSDIFFSWLDNGEWSEDLPIPGASGEGEQTHPSIILDDEANLHVVWVLRKEVGGTTRIRYMLGRLI